VRVPSAEFDEAALRVWGADFARALKPPAVITIRGDLGAGKTTLVQAMAAGLGVVGEVTSPTYALVHEYASTRVEVAHVDLYRLDRAEQLPQIGWQELVSTRGVLFVEWPERAPDAIPLDAIALSLEHVPGKPGVRRLTWPA
jgi:tRNA threonylcarbamoyladenosine biosynthesis protein TsaE